MAASPLRLRLRRHGRVRNVSARSAEPRLKSEQRALASIFQQAEEPRFRARKVKRASRCTGQRSASTMRVPCVSTTDGTLDNERLVPLLRPVRWTKLPHRHEPARKACKDQSRWPGKPGCSNPIGVARHGRKCGVFARVQADRSMPRRYNAHAHTRQVRVQADAALPGGSTPRRHGILCAGYSSRPQRANAGY